MICRSCRADKLETEFHKNKNFPDRNNRQTYCKECAKAYYNSPKGQEAILTYRLATRDYRLKDLSTRYHTKYKQIREDSKYKALCYYSLSTTPSCQCCGEESLEFLTLDHIEGGGNNHRKIIGSDIYYWITKNNYPEGFRTLCMNCNFSFGIRGYCPHNLPVNIKVHTVC